MELSDAEALALHGLLKSCGIRKQPEDPLLDSILAAESMVRIKLAEANQAIKTLQRMRQVFRELLR